MTNDATERDMPGYRASDRISQANIGSAADELVRDPESYFRRRRELRSREAEVIVADRLDEALDQRQPSPLRKLLTALTSGVGIEGLDDETLEDLAACVHAERVARDRRRRSRATVPQRALAVDALELLGVPAGPQTIARVVEARTDVRIDPRYLTSARRDERRIWMRERNAAPTSTPRLAPALHHETLEAVRGLVTLSTWPLRQRMITPASPRADRPKLVLALLSEARRLSATDAHAATRLSRLASALAVGIPGAPATRGTVDRKAVERAALTELNRHASTAAAEREAAASRAANTDPVTQTWGRSDSRRRW